MNIMNLYVYENRSMSNDLYKPIMLENLNVDTVQVHIPKEIDGTDMGTWAWWLVYQNAKREKYSIPMTLEGVTNSEGEEEYIATVGLNHGFTGKHGTVMYAIEAVQADGSGAVTNEWHTKTYKLEIVYTLQGNQTEYDESESDIISALISRVNELITSGAEIAEIAETIENAAETAQEVIDSIPADYSTLSNRVGANTIALAEKADRSTTYTKTEVDALIDEVEVETDTTLEIAGAPADAAETGRQIGLLKADLGSLTSDVMVSYTITEWERKAISVQGVISNSTTRIKTISPIPEYVESITPETGYKIGIWGFDGDTCMGYWSTVSFVKVHGTPYHDGTVDLTAIRAKQPTYTLWGIGVTDTTTDTITLDDADNFVFYGSKMDKLTQDVEKLPAVDATLSTAGDSADALVTGKGLRQHQHELDYGMKPLDEPTDGYWTVGAYLSFTNFVPSKTYSYTYRNMMKPLEHDVYLYIPDLDYAMGGFTYTVSGDTKTVAETIGLRRCIRIKKGYCFTISIKRMSLGSVDGTVTADHTFAQKVFVCGPCSAFFTMEPYFVSATIFDRIAIMGDSYGAGAGSAPTAQGKFSWGKTMGRLINSQVDLFCQSGQGTTQWISNSSTGLAALLNTDRYGLYWYGHGINDASKAVDASTCGTVEDLTTYADIDYTTPDGDEKTACLSTLYGRIGYIIRSIQKYAPKSKIVIATVVGMFGCFEVDYPNYRAINIVLENVAEFYGLPLIDYRTSFYYNTDIYRAHYTGQQVANHPLGITHSGMGAENLRLLQKAMIDNLEYFWDYIGTYEPDES